MTDSAHPVLVGIDGTASGLEALALGSAFAVITGLPLVLGAVYGYQGGSFAGGLVWPPRADAERWLEEAQHRLCDLIRAVVAERLQAGRDTARAAVAAVSPAVDPEVVVAEGDPVECLERASHDLDVLVVGSRRFGPLRSALLGGVSSPLIERAACPVVIVPRGVHAESSDAVVAEEHTHA